MPVLYPSEAAIPIYQNGVPDNAETENSSAGASTSVVRGLKSSLLSMDANTAARHAYEAAERGDMAASKANGLRALQLSEQAQRSAPRVQDITRAQGLGDVVDWTAGQVGGGVPGLVKPAAAGLAGALVGRFGGPRASSVLGTTAALGSMYPDMTDAAVMEHMQAQQGELTPDAARRGLRESSWQGAAQLAPFAVAPAITGPMRLAGVKPILPTPKSFGGAFAQGAAVQGGLGAASTAIGHQFQDMYNPGRDKSEDTASLINSFASNALLGAPAEAMGHAGQSAHNITLDTGGLAKRAAVKATGKVGELATQAWENRPKSLDEAAMRVGEGTAKLSNHIEDTYTRLREMGADADVDTLLRPQHKDMDFNSWSQDNDAKHAAVDSLMAKIQSSPNEVPEFVRNALDQYAQGSRLMDTWRPVRDAVNDWKRTKDYGAAVSGFFEKTGLRMGEAAAKVGNAYDVGRAAFNENVRNNAQRPFGVRRPPRFSDFERPNSTPENEGLGAPGSEKLGTTDNQLELLGFSRGHYSGHDERLRMAGRPGKFESTGALTREHGSNPLLHDEQDPFASILQRELAPLTPFKTPEAQAENMPAVAFGMRAWVKNGFSMKSGDDMVVPRNLLTMFKDPAAAVQKTVELMHRQGEVDDSVVPQMSRVLHRLDVMQESLKSATDLVRDNLTPVAQETVRTTQLRSMAYKLQELLDGNEVQRFEANRQATELFGNRATTVLEALRSQDDAYKAELAAREQGDGERMGSKKLVEEQGDAKVSGDQEALRGMTNEINPNTVEDVATHHFYKTVAEKNGPIDPETSEILPFDHPYEQGRVITDKQGNSTGKTHDQHADARAADLSAKNGSNVKRQGYIDYLRETHPNEEDLPAFKQKLTDFMKVQYEHALRYSLEADKVKAAHHETDRKYFDANKYVLDKLNKQFFVLREETASDKGERTNINPEEFGGGKTMATRKNRWAESGGTPSQGKIYFERRSGDKSVAPSVFATSTSKIIRRMGEMRKRSGEKSAEGLSDLAGQVELLHQGIASMLTAHDGQGGGTALTGRVGFKRTADGPVEWMNAFDERTSGNRTKGMTRKQIAALAESMKLPDDLRMHSGEGKTYAEAKDAVRRVKYEEAEKVVKNELESVKARLKALQDDGPLGEFADVDRKHTELQRRKQELESGIESKSHDVLQKLASEISAVKQDRASAIDADYQPLKTLSGDETRRTKVTSVISRDDKGNKFDTKAAAMEYAESGDKVVKRGGSWVVEREYSSTETVRGEPAVETMAMGKKGISRSLTEDLANPNAPTTHERIDGGAEKHPAKDVDEAAAKLKAERVEKEQAQRAQTERAMGDGAVKRPTIEAKSELSTKSTLPKIVDPKKATYLLNKLREGADAFLKVFDTMSFGQRGEASGALALMIKADANDPMWGGKPPLDMKAFRGRAERMLAKVEGYLNTRDENGKVMTTKKGPSPRTREITAHLGKIFGENFGKVAHIANNLNEALLHAGIKFTDPRIQLSVKSDRLGLKGSGVLEHWFQYNEGRMPKELMDKMMRLIQHGKRDEAKNLLMAHIESDVEILKDRILNNYTRDLYAERMRGKQRDISPFTKYVEAQFARYEAAYEAGAMLDPAIEQAVRAVSHGYRERGEKIHYLALQMEARRDSSVQSLLGKLTATRNGKRMFSDVDEHFILSSVERSLAKNIEYLPDFNLELMSRTLTRIDEAKKAGSSSFDTEYAKTAIDSDKAPRHVDEEGGTWRKYKKTFDSSREDDGAGGLTVPRAEQETVDSLTARSLSTWCTSRGMASHYLSEGDFWVYSDSKGATKFALQLNGDRVGQIQNANNNGQIALSDATRFDWLAKSGKLNDEQSKALSKVLADKNLVRGSDDVATRIRERRLEKLSATFKPEDKATNTPAFAAEVLNLAGLAATVNGDKITIHGDLNIADEKLSLFFTVSDYEDGPGHPDDPRVTTKLGGFVFSNIERITGDLRMGGDNYLDFYTESALRNVRVVEGDVYFHGQTLADLAKEESYLLLSATHDLPRLEISEEIKAAISRMQDEAALADEEFQRRSQDGTRGYYDDGDNGFDEFNDEFPFSMKDGRVQGFYNPVDQKAYLIADSIAKGDETAVAMHEVGVHLGMQKMLGAERYTRLTEQIKSWEKSDGLEGEIAREARERVIAAGTRGDQANDEMLAHFVEAAVNRGITPENAKGGLRQWFAEMWEAVKTAMSKLGWDTSKLTAKDVVQLAHGAAQMEMDDRGSNFTSFVGRSTRDNAQDPEHQAFGTSTNPGEGVATTAERVKFFTDIARRLGPEMKSVLEEQGIFNKGSKIPLSGQWTEGLIRASVHARDLGQVGAHESFHEFFSRLGKEPAAAKVIDILTKAASSEFVQRQLETLLHADKQALKQIKDGAPHAMEERMAYMFQFHQAGLLKVGPPTRSVFQKIADMFRKVTGLLTDDMKADKILRAFDKGETPTADAAAKYLANNIEAREKMFRSVNEALRPALDRASRLVNTAETNLERTGSKTLHEVRRLFKRSVGEDGEQGFLDAKDHQMKMKFNKVSQIFEGRTPEELQAVAGYLHSGKSPNLPWMKKMIKDIKGPGGLLPEMEKYLKDAGVMNWVPNPDGQGGAWEPMGHVKNYFPRAFDTAAMVAKTSEFVADLMEHNLPQLEKLAKETSTEGSVRSAQEVAESIANRLINGFGADPELGETSSAVGFSPYMQAINKRSLNWIDPKVLEKWGEKDVAKILTSYVAQGIKRAEYVRRFGNGGEELKSMLTTAHGEVFDGAIEKKYGLKNATGLSTVRDKDGEVDHAATRNKLIGLIEKSGKTVDKAELSKLEERVLKKMQGASKDVMALEGTLGYNINNTFRKFSNSALVYENLRVLSTSLFSQFIDPLGLVIRGATMQDAWESYKRGIREVVASIRNEGGVGHVQDRQAEIAGMVGTIDSGSALAAYGQLYSSQFMGPMFRKANDMLFKYNGMEGFNRGMQVSATTAAINFIKRHSQNPGKNSEAFLKELNLKAKDVKIDEKGDLDYTDPKIQQAIHQWVNGAIMRPNAAQRPAWGSDPHYMVVWHMKQFAYTFHDVIMKRALHDMKKFGDMGPAGVLVAAYTPVMIATDALKSVLLTGDEPGWMRAGLGSEIQHGAMRAGLMGKFQPAADVMAPHRSVLGLGGPLVEQIEQMFHQSPTDAAINALPGANVWNAMKGGAMVEMQGED